MKKKLLLLSALSLLLVQIGSGQVYDTSNDKVGIGNPNPDEKLDVKGNILIRNPEQNGALIISPAISGYQLYPELLIQASETGSGNNSNFHISRNAFFRTSDDSYQYISNSNYPATGIEFSNLGDINFRYADASTGTVVWKSRLFIDGSTGAVGVGITNPSESSLHIYRNSTIGSFPSPILSNATLKIEDSSFKLYMDGNAIISDISGTSGRMTIGTINDANIVFGTSSIERLRIDYNGNIGIGTVSPDGNLDISSSVTPKVYIQSSASSSQDAILNIRGSRTSSTFNDIAQIIFGSNDANGGDLAFITARKKTANTNEGDLLFWTTTTNGNTPTEKLRVKANGNVGIGTDSPAYKLDVAGTIRAHEVIVEIAAPAPDYVFEPDYKLRTLSEVESFVKENKHLPDVPAGESMEQNGIGVAEMNMLLLKKVEEMTLYMIEMKKENEALKARVEKLEASE